MKHLKHIAALVISIISMGSVYAYPSGVYPDRIVLAQHRVVAREVHVVQPQPRARRFVMQPNGVVYQRQYTAPPANYPRSTRMSAEQRRALRSQINEANRGMYNRSRSQIVPQR